MRSDLTETALKRALWNRKPPKGLMVHTDQGSQFNCLMEAGHIKRVVSEYIGYYNHDRPHSINEYLSLIEFEQLRLNEIAQIENNLGTK